MRKLVLAFVSASLAFSFGCKSQPDQDAAVGDILMGDILRKRTGMVSIFPPREDVRVGDLYVYPVNPEKGDRPLTLDAVPRYGTVEGVTLAVQAQYKDRPDFPPTPDDYLPAHSGEPSARTWAEASYTDGVYFNEDPSDRLRLVVLPPISLTRDALGDVLPGDGVNLAVGELFSEWKSITLRPQAAESYALDLDDMLDLIVERDSVGRMILKQPYRDKITFGAGAGGGSVWVRIVSEVLYIRAAQVSILAEGNVDDDVRASEFTLEGDADENADALDPAFAAIVRADAINQAIRDNGSDVLPDGFVRFLSLNETFMSMQRVWRRPVAIGARGFTLEVDSITGEILASGLIGKTLRSHVEEPPGLEEE